MNNAWPRVIALVFVVGIVGAIGWKFSDLNDQLDAKDARIAALEESVDKQVALKLKAQSDLNAIVAKLEAAKAEAEVIRERLNTAKAQADARAASLEARLKRIREEQIQPGGAVAWMKTEVVRISTEWRAAQ